MILISLVVFSGCASVISRGTLESVDKSIRFEQIFENPEAYLGRMVLLGGEILDTTNLPEETRIVVLQRPLEYRHKPTSNDRSKGRFIISAAGFLDPAIYQPGRKVTVVGSILGIEVRRLDHIDYTYPLVAKNELYLWPLEEYPAKATSVYMSIGGAVGIGVRR